MLFRSGFVVKTVDRGFSDLVPGKTHTRYGTNLLSSTSGEKIYSFTPQGDPTGAFAEFYARMVEYANPWTGYTGPIINTLDCYFTVQITPNPNIYFGYSGPNAFDIKAKGLV